MIKNVGNIVPCPASQHDHKHNPLAQPEKMGLTFVEVFPKTPKEIAFYGKIDKRYRSAADLYPHKWQSPLLVEIGEARRQGII